MNTVIYTRLSDDKSGDSTATARQLSDCEKLAAMRDMPVVARYEDNDVSAYQRKVRRPAFEDLLAHVASGEVGAVIVWRSDRFARQPRDLERFLDIAEPSGTQLLSVTEPEFGGRTGLLILRMLVAFASHESGVKSERVSRKSREQAEAGNPRYGGSRPFGYTAQYVPHTAEAGLYREAVDRIIFGERPTDIANDWNARGITTVKGSRWTSSNLARTLRAPVHAGIRAYRGERFDGTWEPLISSDLWYALQERLNGY